MKTEFEFELPHGYVDAQEKAHRRGTMRLATAADEILPARDPRVQSNPAYLSVVILARVITRLGDITNLNTQIVENLFAADFAYLQDFYNRINESGKATLDVVCPGCGKRFEADPSPGEP
jgi:hypothetical protein